MLLNQCDACVARLSTNVFRDWNTRARAGVNGCMRKAPFAAALAALALAAAPAWGQTAPASLNGRVVGAGRCSVPLGATDNTCPDRPFATTLLIQSPDGQQVASVSTADDGTFSVDLPPGSYQVEPLLADGSPPATGPIAVDVPVDPVSGVTIRVDGGIATRE